MVGRPSSDDARRPDEAPGRLESALASSATSATNAQWRRTLNSLGVVARSLGQLEQATELFTESLERKRRIGDESGIAVTLSNLGVVEADRGDVGRAADFLAEALAVDEASGSTSAVVMSCANLGSILIRAGRTDEGIQQIRRRARQASLSSATRRSSRRFRPASRTSASLAPTRTARSWPHDLTLSQRSAPA